MKDISLLLDTSSQYINIVLSNNENGVKRIVLKDKIFNQSKISEHILEYISNALNSSGLSLKDINKYIVSIGPGAFTGLRIGIATMEAFALSYNKQIRGISSLDLFALSLGNDKYKLSYKLKNDYYIARKYDFANEIFSEYYYINEKESRDSIIINSVEILEKIDVSNFFMSNYSQFLKNTIPLYFLKSQAEINLENS